MENYSIYLPLYDEVSTRFKNFVLNMSSSSYLPNYLAQFSQNRLFFSPSVRADEEKVLLKRISISVKSTSNKKSHLDEISTFATKFNMLASIALSRFNKCTFTIKLCDMPDEFPNSLYVLTVTLSTRDKSVSMAIDNLFKVLV